jgi:hypothetical protein
MAAPTQVGNVYEFSNTDVLSGVVIAKSMHIYNAGPTHRTFTVSDADGTKIFDWRVIGNSWLIPPITWGKGFRFENGIKVTMTNAHATDSLLFMEMA